MTTTTSNVKLNGNNVTWVLFDTCMHHTYKYQKKVAEKYGFKEMPSANGVRIYGKFYGSREALQNDKENIKTAINALRTYNSGKVIGGIGTVISDTDFGKGTYEEPHRGWTSEGSMEYVELMK